MKINENMFAVTCTERSIIFVVCCCCSHLLTLLTYICIVDRISTCKSAATPKTTWKCIEMRNETDRIPSVWKIAYTIKYGSLNYEQIKCDFISFFVKCDIIVVIIFKMLPSQFDDVSTEIAERLQSHVSLARHTHTRTLELLIYNWDSLNNCTSLIQDLLMISF